MACFLGAGLARGELRPTTLEKPIAVQAALESKEKVGGQLVKFDAESLTIKTAAGERTIKWSELTAASRYNIRATVADRKDAEQWLDLAELAMQAGMREQAKVCVTRASTIEPKTRLRGEAILRGQGNAKAAEPAVGEKSSGKGSRAAPATGPAKQLGVDAVAVPMKPAEGAVVRYQKSTPEQDAAAIKLAQEVAAGVKKQLKIKLSEFQTPHFIIFTDWDEREFGFLKTNLEKAYSVVSKEFNIPDSDNVFVGKLPVFMFAKQADFAKYTAVVEGFPAQQGLLGYYRGHGDGSGHMVMWKPDVKRYGGDVRQAELQWAYTLTHEFTHAFVARYRTNRHVPRWLHEGVAEVIAARQFPMRGAYTFARQMADARFNFQNLFDDDKKPGGDMYPVMRTMVEALLEDDYKAFLAMFNDIKDGLEPGEALKKHYKATYPEFEKAWRGYARKLRE